MFVAPQHQGTAICAVHHESSQAGRPAWEGERREAAPVVEGGEERCALQVVGGRAAARHGGRTREGDEEATNAAALPRLGANTVSVALTARPAELSGPVALAMGRKVIPLHATLLCACRSPRLASRGAQRGTVTGP